MDEKQRLKIKYGFGAVLVLLGLVLNAFDLGKNYFFGYNSVGTYLIFCGFIMFILLLIKSFRKKKEPIDERMLFIASKATRLTFMFFITCIFAIMIVDGISPITMHYSQFMSHFVCVIILFYFVSYKILLKLN
jgi:hypothetical protein